MESLEHQKDVTSSATDAYIEPEDLPPVVTVAEIARLLRVRPNLVYTMHRRGEIPGGRRVGRSIRFSRKIVLEWLFSGETGKKRRHH